jgi:hypothetical protein
MKNNVKRDVSFVMIHGKAALEVTGNNILALSFFS